MVCGKNVTWYVAKMTVIANVKVCEIKVVYSRLKNYKVFKNFIL